MLSFHDEMASATSSHLEMLLPESDLRNWSSAVLWSFRHICLEEAETGRCKNKAVEGGDTNLSFLSVSLFHDVARCEFSEMDERSSSYSCTSQWSWSSRFLN